MKEKVIKGDFVWADPERKVLEWKDNPKGKYTRIAIQYNWIERLLIKIKLMKDRNWSLKYVIGVDPI